MISFKEFRNVLILVFLVFWSCEPQVKAPEILYYANPMDPTVHSEVPMKDSMGMDYLPVYEEPKVDPKPASKGKILYYANPMDPTVHSDVFMKDSMGMDYVPIYDESSQSEEGTRSLRLSVAQEELIGVSVTPVVLQTLTGQVQTVGRVSYNEKKTTVVSSRVSGRIERLYVNFTGSTVAAGQALLSLYSPSLITAQQELIQAARSRKGSEPGGIEDAIYQSAKGKLDLWGFSGYQLDNIVEQGTPQNTLVLTSPLTGTVVRLAVSTGMYVEEGTVLYELSDLSRVWIEAEIFEKDLSSVTPESRIRVVPLAYPGETFEDKISFINPSLDPNTRTIKIRTEIPNPKGLLLPGMFVSVLVLTPAGAPVLTIPESAVIDTGLRKMVYVRVSPGRYAARDVVLGSRSGNLYPVVRGLEAGEEVVTSANFLIDSESRLKGLVE